MDPNLSSVPLPPSWPDHVKSAFLNALGMAHMGIACVRGWCANSPVTQVGLNGDNERLKSEVELLREELRIKDSKGRQKLSMNSGASGLNCGRISAGSRQNVLCKNAGLGQHALRTKVEQGSS